MINLNSEQALCTGEPRNRLGIVDDRCCAVNVQLLTRFKIQKQHTGIGINKQVADCVEQVVALVVRHRDLGRAVHSDKTRLAATVADIHAFIGRA